MTGPVLFWVQHLLGIGHQRRSAAIARATAAAGLEVHYISGGMPLPDLDLTGCRFHQLPPCRSPDDSFSSLVDENGQTVQADFWTERQSQLLQLISDIGPSVFVTETYPFGRRAFRHELLPALKQVRRTGVNVASVRDILVRKPDPARYRESAELINRYYQAVLVHEPAGLTGFSDSFPCTDQIADKISRTGYVAEQRINPETDSNTDRTDSEVLVSGGGSDVALPLFRAALSARQLSSQTARNNWRLLVGRGVAEADFQALADAAGDGVIVERTRPDFHDLLRRARVSVSLAGYNTVIDGLITGPAMVLVPFATESETEQTDRARSMVDAGYAISVGLQTVTATDLALAVDQAIGLRHQPCHADWFRGAEESARILHRLAGQISE